MRYASMGYAGPATPILDPSRGKRLTEAIERSGMSRYDIARATGLSRVTIQNIEHGRSRGNAATWVSIARALKVDPDELVGASR